MTQKQPDLLAFFAALSVRDRAEYLAFRIPGLPVEMAAKYLAQDERPERPDDQPTNEVRLFGEIVPADSFLVAWFGDAGVTTNENFKAQLDRAEGDITLLIDSPGGDHFIGNSIAMMLDDYRALGHKVEGRVLGVSASAATYAMVRSDSVSADALSTVMIHEPYGGGRNMTASGHRSFAEKLDAHRDAVASVYAGRRDIEVGKVRAWMSANEGRGTEFIGPAIVEAGFADSIRTDPAAGGDSGETVEARMSASSLNLRDAIREMAISGLQNI